MKWWLATHRVLPAAALQLVLAVVAALLGDLEVPMPFTPGRVSLLLATLIALVGTIAPVVVLRRHGVIEVTSIRVLRLRHWIAACLVTVPLIIGASVSETAVVMARSLLVFFGLMGLASVVVQPALIAFPALLALMLAGFSPGGTAWWDPLANPLPHGHWPTALGVFAAGTVAYLWKGRPGRSGNAAD